MGRFKRKAIGTARRVKKDPILVYGETRTQPPDILKMRVRRWANEATGDRSENPVGDRHPSSDPGWRRTGGTRCNKGRFPNRSTCPQTDSSSAGSSRHSPVGIRRRVRSRTCLRNCRCRRCRLVSSRGGPGGGTWPYWPPTADAISGNDLSFAFTLIEITK